MNKNLIEEYESILKLKKDKLSNLYLKQSGEEGVLGLVKYAIENILHYTPTQAERVLTYEQLEHLKLMQYVDTYVSFLSGLNEFEVVNGVKRRKIKTESLTIKYLLNKIYPAEVRFNKIDYITHIYEDVLAKKISFPKGFFKMENNGKLCAYVCFNYMLTRYIINTEVKIANIKVNSVKDLYNLFGDKKIGSKILAKYKLAGAVKELFDNNPLLMLHSLINPNMKSELYYRYNLFNEQYKLIK